MYAIRSYYASAEDAADLLAGTFGEWSGSPPARVGQMVLAVSEEDPRGTRCIFRLVEADGTPPE